MPDHLIHLRRAWEGDFPENGTTSPRRIDLPTIWMVRPSAPFRLERVFHRPPLEPGTEILLLRLDSVAGLTAVSLNGLVLGGTISEGSGLILPIAHPLSPRNRLVLDVDPSAWDDTTAPWGEVALVIRSGAGKAPA